MKTRILHSLFGLVAAAVVIPGAEAQAPAAPANLRLKDRSGFARVEVRLRWDRDEAKSVFRYEIERADGPDGQFQTLAVVSEVTSRYDDVLSEIAYRDLEALERAERDFATLDGDGDGALTPEEFSGTADAFELAGAHHTAEAQAALEAARGTTYQEKCEHIDPTTVQGKPPKVVTAAGIASALASVRIDPERTYRYRVTALSESGERSPPAELPEAVSPGRDAFATLRWKTASLFDWSRGWFMVVTLLICLSVVYFIFQARGGRELQIRKIAGLEAVDEAVGRATEMGRPILFVPGNQDMNDIQTIAGISILSRVSKTAAEFDAKVEVPTSRALVMTTAREAVQASFLAAGRPDAYNEDLIYYVTDEQFGYVAYLSGMMVREKPAACFYMGAFYAESLILAETGNSIGAIQVAGTAMPAQLPFFVAACDYTLIGEEFFAASAYLSGSPEELGSLKGQDVGKVLVAVVLVVGCAIATLASLTDSDFFDDALEYVTKYMLT